MRPGALGQRGARVAQLAQPARGQLLHGRRDERVAGLEVVQVRAAAQARPRSATRAVVVDA